jgi:hypothetical protein
MPSKTNGSKRKADAPPSGETKSARTSRTSDAPSSQRGMYLTMIIYHFRISFFL